MDINSLLDGTDSAKPQGKIVYVVGENTGSTVARIALLLPSVLVATDLAGKEIAEQFKDETGNVNFTAQLDVDLGVSLLSTREYLKENGYTLAQINVKCLKDSLLKAQAKQQVEVSSFSPFENSVVKPIAAEMFDPSQDDDLVYIVNEPITKLSDIRYSIVPENEVQITEVWVR